VTVPKTIPSSESGFSGCSINQRCFYEGAAKERICSIETICIRDREVRNGVTRVNVARLNGEREVTDADDRAPLRPEGGL